MFEGLFQNDTKVIYGTTSGYSSLVKMLTRRDFLKLAGIFSLWPQGCIRQMSGAEGVLVNDVHSQLNPTTVNRIMYVDSVQAIQAAIKSAGGEGRPVCITGGRHAMGAQQFATDGVLMDMTKLNRVLNFDAGSGIVEVEAGIEWPELINYLLEVQSGKWPQWGIIQKQTGADRLSIGGALAANVHGRGLRFKPIIQDVESFVLTDLDGNLHACSRRENAELFRLAIGGYGLFGIIVAVKLRLAPRTKIERVVKTIDLENLMPALEKRIADGFTYGDFQYSTYADSSDFLRKGVFSCYRPVDESTKISEAQKSLSLEDWKRLVYLAHVDKKQAFDVYSTYYLSTSGQTYWSDTHQLSTYLGNYHRVLDHRLGTSSPATEIITEIYVPRHELVGFMEEIREDFRRRNVNLIYGTIRLIERDDESFLAWAKKPYACIIFNLHTVHTAEGLLESAKAFRRLIEVAIHRGGSYYLTYHKYATREQVLACYPQFPEFLSFKKKYDPEERFQSDWYRHYKSMFTEV
jgi:FAD/FMN-containing dehydrogenase